MVHLLMHLFILNDQQKALEMQFCQFSALITNSLLCSYSKRPPGEKRLFSQTIHLGTDKLLGNKPNVSLKVDLVKMQIRDNFRQGKHLVPPNLLAQKGLEM